MSLCEENCDLVEYNYTTEKAKCSCSVKINILDDIKFDKNKLYKNFIDINNIANIKFLKNVLKMYLTETALRKIMAFLFLYLYLYYILYVYFFSDINIISSL